MYIKKLELLNFQIIEKFEAEFNGSVYFITGDNELGKSTLLKAIGALLTGQRDDVLRNGASKGFAKMVVGDDGEEFDVSLSFSETNPRGTLTIKQKTTGMQSNNVSMLQRIFGYQDFDAVEFSRWSETAEGRRKQIAVVKSLLPEQIRQRIEVIDEQVAALKSERTGVNRDVKTFESFVTELSGKLGDIDPDDYEKPIDVSNLMERQQKNVALAERAKNVRGQMELRKNQLAATFRKEQEIRDRRDKSVEFAEAELKAAQKRYDERLSAAKKEMDEALLSLDAERKDLEMRRDNAEKWLKDYEASNPEKNDVSSLLEQAEAHNKRFALVQQYREKKAQYEEVKAKADSMDASIDTLGKERAGLIAGAELPISGLSFSEDGLTLNGVDFIPGKVSDSQTMEVATKLIIASNPTVKVFRIARGESLGAKRLQAIVDIAKRNGFQGFIEQVKRGQDEMQIEEYTEA